MNKAELVAEKNTGLVFLVLAALVAITWSMLCITAVGQTPVPAIMRSGLIGNGFAFVLAWYGLLAGHRSRVIHQIVAITMVSIVHYFLMANIWSVFFLLKHL